MTILEKINSDSKLLSICRNIKQLKINGMDNKEIEKAIFDLELPLKLHLFILGNFTKIISFNY